MAVVYTHGATLSRDLGISLKSLYSVSNNIACHYKTAEIPKKGGGFRRLALPSPQLAAIQRAILCRLLVYMPISPYATAYRFGGGVRPNAAPHVGKEMLLRLDIRDFFGSVLYSQVRDSAFPREVYSPPLQALLGILCYYKDGLPQGAPTSPYISNLVMGGFDMEVGQWCGARGICYTRYCDDMTFSGSFDKNQVVDFVGSRLRAMGFFLNEKKTRLSRKSARQQVTGVVVNQAMAVSRDYRRRLRQELYYCRRFGVEAHIAALGIQTSAAQYLQSLAGRAAFVLSVDPCDRDGLEVKNWTQGQLKKYSAG